LLLFLFELSEGKRDGKAHQSTDHRWKKRNGDEFGFGGWIEAEELEVGREAGDEFRGEDVEVVEEPLGDLFGHGWILKVVEEGRRAESELEETRVSRSLAVDLEQPR